MFVSHIISLIFLQIKALPAMMSYSPVQVPSLKSRMAHKFLAKRDLFAARFQLISTGTSALQAEEGSNADASSLAAALQFVEAPSGLVPRVYEGGLKTWECSIDLAGTGNDRLASLVTQAGNLRILEVKRKEYRDSDAPG